MGRKSKAKFKMKGHTLPGINQKSETPNLKDGRANSSAFQYASPIKNMKTGKYKQAFAKYKSAFKQTEDDLREYLLSEVFPTQEDVDNAIKDGSWTLESPEFVEWYAPMLQVVARPEARMTESWPEGVPEPTASAQPMIVTQVKPDWVTQVQWDEASDEEKEIIVEIREVEDQMEGLKEGSQEFRHLEHLHRELVNSLPPFD